MLQKQINKIIREEVRRQLDIKDSTIKEHAWELTRVMIAKQVEKRCKAVFESPEFRTFERKVKDDLKDHYKDQLQNYCSRYKEMEGFAQDAMSKAAEAYREELKNKALEALKNINFTCGIKETE